MGLLPDMLPGYTPIGEIDTRIADEQRLPASTCPRLRQDWTMLEIFDAAGKGNLSALYVVGANPIARYGVDAAR